MGAAGGCRGAEAIVSFQRRAQWAGGLRVVNPVFQRQVGQVGEVADIARDEGEAVPEGCAAYHQVEVIDGATHGAQAYFLQTIYFKAGADQQNAASEKLLQDVKRMAVGHLSGRGAFGDAVNQFGNVQLAQKTVVNAYLPYFLAQAELVFGPMNANVGIKQVLAHNPTSRSRK